MSGVPFHKPKMGTLQAAWADYAQQCIPAGAPDLQINEGKVCFMAGCAAMFKLMTIDAADLPEEKAMELMVELGTEMQTFVSEYARTGIVP